jgi:hypothetical protein
VRVRVCVRARCLAEGRRSIVVLAEQHQRCDKRVLCLCVPLYVWYADWCATCDYAPVRARARGGGTWVPSERIRKKRNGWFDQGGDAGQALAADGSPRARPWPDPQQYEAMSLACLSLQNPLRRVCIWGIEQTWWDNGVVILILLNTLQLAMFDPLDNEANLPVSHVTTGKAWPFLGRNVLDIIGLFFTAAFTL